MIPVSMLLKERGSDDGRGEYSLLTPAEDTARQSEDCHEPESDQRSQETKNDSWRDCLTIEVGVLVLVAVVHAAAQSFKGYSPKLFAHSFYNCG